MTKRILILLLAFLAGCATCPDGYVPVNSRDGTQHQCFPKEQGEMK